MPILPVIVSTFSTVSCMASPVLLLFENMTAVNSYVDLFVLFVNNYLDNMVPPRSKYKPVQGGFLVLRPDMKVYNEYKEIVKKGVEKEGQGWGGKVGPFYGWMTFQGLIPYYYDVLHPNEGVELNRCIYNQMADNPKDKRTVNDIPQGRCRTDQEECE